MRISGLFIVTVLLGLPALAFASTPPPPTIDVPEPTSMLLIGAGTLAGFGVAKLRKRRQDR